eukprot:9041197-Pyramimonas_sp.AAC.1
MGQCGLRRNAPRGLRRGGAEGGAFKTALDCWAREGGTRRTCKARKGTASSLFPSFHFTPFHRRSPLDRTADAWHVGRAQEAQKIQKDTKR